MFTLLAPCRLSEERGGHSGGEGARQRKRGQGAEAPKRRSGWADSAGPSAGEETVRKEMGRQGRRMSDFRARLLRRRGELMRRMSALESSAHRFRGFAAPDAADQAKEGEEDELVLRLMELRSREIAEIEEAIEKLVRGGYGCCEYCGERIPATRLRLMPAARYCVRCMEHLERDMAETESPPDWSAVGGSSSGHPLFAETESVSGSGF